MDAERSLHEDDEELLFEEGEEELLTDFFPPSTLKPVPLLIVDDEPGVHAITEVALTRFSYHGRTLQLLHACSAAEARGVLQERQDIAVILLDVVMESDDAGLQLVRWIREELGNRKVRIILRTGQPGQAPERRVIVEYHINDYKAKTELTADKLFTTVVAAIRAYEDIHTVEESRRGLEMILESSGSLMRLRAMQHFGSGLLRQIAALLGVPCDGILCVQSQPAGQERVLAGFGRYQGVESLSAGVVDIPVVTAIQRALRDRHHLYHDQYTVLSIDTRAATGQTFAVFLETGFVPDPLVQMLLQVFCNKMAVAIENIHLVENKNRLLEQLKQAQRATVVTLAGCAEYKDTDTGDHVLRVATLTEAIARRMNQTGPYAGLFPAETLEMIGMASILHDVGKMAIPDAILQKPGPLTPEERAIMESHVERGEAILGKACQMTEGVTYLTLGAEIAGGHHERWDGRGYPRGLAGREIPLTGRIVALVDVFDALSYARPYKSAWPQEQVLALIRQESGRHFDPAVVEAFFALHAAGDAALLVPQAS
ncbi:MAG: DUF3369 domain-containing protein [Magnetococcales bacterium]|nr:DUF3369 domain-containing protein [Magnetococcales bacterium]